MKYDIYVDGACSGNGTPMAIGGWSYIVAKKDTDIIVEEYYGKLRIGDQNSNRAELEAIAQSLKYVDSHPKDCFNIITDCEMLYKAITGMCCRKGNMDMWKEVEYYFLKHNKNRRKIDIEHMKNNKDNKDPEKIKYVLNNKADKLAKKGCNNLLLQPVKPLNKDVLKEKLNILLTIERSAINA